VSHVVVVAPFTVTGANFGGAERVRELANRTRHETTVLSLNWDGVNTTHAGEHYGEQTVAAPLTAIDGAKKLLKLGVHTFDPMPNLLAKHLRPVFDAALDQLQPDLLILEHPWLFPLLGGRKFVYDSHNAETILAASRYGAQSLDVDHARSLERSAVTQCESWAYCSTVDAAHIVYANPDAKPGIHVPNGVTLPDSVSHTPSNRLLFVGSAYQPNVQAAERLTQLAKLLPDFYIDIVGSCCSYLSEQSSNVRLHGVVTNTRLDELFHKAAVFVNLTTAGSGTHLKVGRALAYGVPVVTTEIGARGYTQDGIVVVRKDDDIAETIRVVVGPMWKHLSNAAQSQAATITWDRVSVPWQTMIDEALIT
jgi:glycosyltransferase involved in cell wall biosynthesis